MVTDGDYFCTIYELAVYLFINLPEWEINTFKLDFIILFVLFEYGFQIIVQNIIAATVVMFY